MKKIIKPFILISTLFLLSISPITIYGEPHHTVIQTPGSVISTGHGTSFVIMDDHTLWGWGYNISGQIGNGTTEDQHTPVKIMENVAFVSAGVRRTFAIQTDGSLWAWGGGGQLGDGTAASRLYPVKILENVAFVCAAANMAVTLDGGLWAWGTETMRWFWDRYSTNAYHSPIKIMEDVAYVSAGTFHVAAIKTDGSLWTWGSTRWGLLGDEIVTEGHEHSPPVRVMENVVAVSTGDAHTAAIKSDGSLWMWGNNHWGSLGDGTQIRRYTPTRVMDNVVAVSAGLYSTLAITADYQLWAWGGNSDGQLGIGTFTHSTTPNIVMSDVIAVSAGFTGGMMTGGPGGMIAHTLAMRTDGTIWAWGSNFYGQLGNGTTTGPWEGIATPIKVNIAQPMNESLELRFSIDQAEYTINGVPHITTTAPFIDPTYHRTMVPLRLIAETFGAAVSWSSTTRNATITGNGISLSLNVDTPLPDGMGVPMIVDGTTFVPLAYIAQQFGATAQWDGVARAVYISLAPF